ncbi:hydrophobin 2 [Boletus edulis]|uniref:Hydrophobin n=1 Tax=Boletus edulis BED1 TaxID=1328754 RepID=A0AAD4G6G3_BOLED|nr:hydrophobin 2 [Boletus edulis]KAF8418134.1 hydrophobin [Boletus edulis BED1]
MFIRLSTIFFYVVALVGVATAVPTALEARNSNTCNSGSVNCCQSVQSSDSYQIIELFGYLGIPLPGGNTQIGLTCSPVTLGGSSTGSICTQQTVCCTGNTFYGVSTACSPININL